MADTARKTKARRRPPRAGVRRVTGRPPKEVSPKQVERLAAIGCTQEEIGFALGMSVDTLARRFAEPYNKGQAALKQSLRRKQVNMAKAGNVTMLIWLGKQLLGQSDKREVSGGLAIHDMEEIRKKRWRNVGAAMAAADGEPDEP